VAILPTPIRPYILLAFARAQVLVFPARQDNQAAGPGASLRAGAVRPSIVFSAKRNRQATVGAAVPTRSCGRAPEAPCVLWRALFNFIIQIRAFLIKIRALFFFIQIGYFFLSK
jgi:hypothetical protein